MAGSVNAITASLVNSFAAGKKGDKPYPHWFVENCLPGDVVDQCLGLPFPAPGLGGISGKRELHNATRRYFDAENRAKFSFVDDVCQAFQSPEVTGTIEKTFGSKLKGTYVRIEFAQDIDGFWLEPHTDLGVKMFTFLLYISKDEAHRELGTDIYGSDKKWVARSPFKSNAAMIFVPGSDTYHGFEARPIQGVRKSLVINYVTNDWKAREQLAFPETPIPA
jgi:hypothetical protein